MKLKIKNNKMSFITPDIIIEYAQNIQLLIKQGIITKEEIRKILGLEETKPQNPDEAQISPPWIVQIYFL